MHECVFQRRSKLQESERRVQFDVFEKLTSVCFFQIARETILLLVNNNLDSLTVIGNRHA